MADPFWRDRSACRGKDPRWFELDGRGALADTWNQRAYALCALCPVIRECDEWAAGVDLTGLIVAGRARTATASDVRREARAQEADRKLEPRPEVQCEAGCGATFRPRTASHRCCSDRCRRVASRRPIGEKVAA